MGTRFDKMHGLGNDFVILDARAAPVNITPTLAKALADRHTGIGCDQLILLEPSNVADLKMRIWNQDGGEVQSCGNASRCVVALTGAKTMETGGGIVTGGGTGDDVEVQLPAPKFGWGTRPEMAVDVEFNWLCGMVLAGNGSPMTTLPGPTRRVRGS